MMTAATANEEGGKAEATATAQQHLQTTAKLARGFADDAGRAIGNLLPTASLQNLTARKYTLPDKTVASQVLMYRQLLHTKCRPGLRLSRNYEGTPAQVAVMHMPWWEEGIAETKKMVISYDNLLQRLWLHGAIEPFEGASANANTSANANASDGDLLSLGDGADPTPAGPPEPHTGDNGVPPVPHPFWVDRLGFQQQDPVTDFRSGGVLSLAMMVYMVESRPEVCSRFFGKTHTASVLPFGITCINVTDMIAKFLMLAKSTDRMDALLSQKPFWKMFADPSAITAVQELALSMLCDVAAELGEEKRCGGLLAGAGQPGPGDETATTEVTVFDFSTILERTEKRVRDDLLGAGPKTIDELRSIEGRLRLRYKTQLERRLQRAREQQQQQQQRSQPPTPSGGEAEPGETTLQHHHQQQLKDAMDKASSLAGGFFARVKSGVAHKLGKEEENSAPAPEATIVDLPPAAVARAPASGGSDGDWTGTDIAAATDGITNFSIGDDEDDADLLL